MFMVCWVIHGDKNWQIISGDKDEMLEFVDGLVNNDVILDNIVAASIDNIMVFDMED